MSYTAPSDSHTVGRPNLGVSSCLLGSDVRYNGGNCHNKFLTGELSRFFHWTPVCPEVEMGMTVPREPIRLTGNESDPRAVGLQSGADYTQTMIRFAEMKMKALAPMNLHGYILKSKSPSCGMERIPVYNAKGHPQGRTSGLFARALKEAFPLLPLEEEGRLNDIGLRERFIEAVFAYYRWRKLLSSEPRPKDLVAFHTDHKYQLLARKETTYRQLGRLVAEAGSASFENLLIQYGEGFMSCFESTAKPKSVANVLYHLMGFLKEAIDPDDKRELGDAIDDYQNRKVPLIGPLYLLNHHFRKHPHPWVARQTFLEPYPLEFNMRSHV